MKKPRDWTARLKDRIHKEGRKRNAKERAIKSRKRK